MHVCWFKIVECEIATATALQQSYNDIGDLNLFFFCVETSFHALKRAATIVYLNVVRHTNYLLYCETDTHKNIAEPKHFLVYVFFWDVILFPYNKVLIANWNKSGQKMKRKNIKIKIVFMDFVGVFSSLCCCSCFVCTCSMSCAVNVAIALRVSKYCFS